MPSILRNIEGSYWLTELEVQRETCISRNTWLISWTFRRAGGSIVYLNWLIEQSRAEAFDRQHPVVELLHVLLCLCKYESPAAQVLIRHECLHKGLVLGVFQRFPRWPGKLSSPLPLSTPVVDLVLKQIQRMATGAGEVNACTVLLDLLAAPDEHTVHVLTRFLCVNVGGVVTKVLKMVEQASLEKSSMSA